MRSRSSTVPIVQSVGPMRSIVAFGTTIRIRTVAASRRTRAAVARGTCRTGRGARARRARSPRSRTGAFRRPRSRLQSNTVDQRGVRGEATLRRRDGDVLAAQDLRMIDGDSVKCVTLGHAGCDVTGTLGAS